MDTATKIVALPCSCAGQHLSLRKTTLSCV